MGKNPISHGDLPDRDSLFTLTLSSTDLKKALQEQFTPEQTDTDLIILQDGESEVVFYKNSIRVAVKDGFVIFDVKLETDQTGVGHLVIPFRLGNSLQQASLTLTTESLPRGNQSLSARWGTILQEQLWFGLLSVGENLVRDKSTNANLRLTGLYTVQGRLVFVYCEPATIIEIKDYIDQVKTEGFDPGHEDFNPVAVDLDAVEPDQELSLFEQFLRELYRLFLQIIRFTQKSVQLAVYLIRKLVDRLRQ